MKTKLFKSIFAVMIMMVIPMFCLAQTGEGSNETASIMDKIMNWVTGGGLIALLAVIGGFWKKGVSFVGKAAGALFGLTTALGNILVQTTEANAKIKNGFSKLKTYAADDKFTKEELEDMIVEIQGAIDEVDDIPVAIKQFRDEFNEVVDSFRKK